MYMNPIFYIPIQTAEAEASLASDDLYSPDLRASLAAGQYKLLRIFSRDIPQRRFRSRSTWKMIRFLHDSIFCYGLKMNLWLIANASPVKFKNSNENEPINYTETHDATMEQEFDGFPRIFFFFFFVENVWIIIWCVIFSFLASGKIGKFTNYW